jgi:pyrimidine-nucleoside phosphorylase
LRNSCGIYALRGNVDTLENCKALAEETLYDGSALSKLAALVERLGGDRNYVYDTSLFEESNVTAILVAEKSGYISRIDAHEVGLAASVLGAGREVMGQAIDHSAGIILNKQVGDRIEEGEALATLQAQTLERAQNGMEYLFKAVTISAFPPEEKKIVIKSI